MTPEVPSTAPRATRLPFGKEEGRRGTILLLTTSYPGEGDGREAAGAFVADIAKELSLRTPVRVVAPGRVCAADTADGGLSVRRYSAPDRPLSLLSPHRPGDAIQIVRTLASFRRQARAAAADGDVVHTLAMWALPSGWVARGLLRRCGIPYSLWALGSDIWSLGRMPLLRGLLRRVTDGATNCYADGLQLGRDARLMTGREYRYLPSTRRLSSGRSGPGAKSSPYRLVFLGRWHPNKGVDLLMQALRLLNEDDWQRIAEVRIAGGGPLAGLVHAEAEKLQASGRPVRLDGYLDRDAATAALSEADFLLLPSRIESVPVVFSDAMKMGLPVVSMPVGDLPDLIGEGRVGVLAAEVSSGAFAGAIRIALSSRREEFFPGITRMVERFNLGSIADKLLADVGVAGGEVPSPETIRG